MWYLLTAYSQPLSNNKYYTYSHGTLLEVGELCEKRYRWPDISGEYLADIHNKEFCQMSHSGFYPNVSE